MLTRDDILRRPPGNIRISTAVSSSHQSDGKKRAHPASVKLWETCPMEVMDHVNGLPQTDACFPTSHLPSTKVSMCISCVTKILRLV